MDHEGNPVKDACVLWGAICPDPAKGFKGEVKLMINGENVRFTPPFEKDPAYMLSAQPGVRAGAVNNRKDGFILSMVKHDRTLARNVWTQ